MNITMTLSQQSTHHRCLALSLRATLAALLWTTALISSDWWREQDLSKLAVITAPVVNYFIDPIIQQDPPLCMSGSASSGACRRGHQGLFNEVVQLREMSNDLANIADEHIVYKYDEQSGAPICTFWLAREYLTPLNTLSSAVLSAIPSPEADPQATIVLILPWRSYSFGTKFIRAPEYDADHYYGALIPNVRAGTADIILIPRAVARPYPLGNGLSDRTRASIVATALRIIAHAAQNVQDGIIPYVWGGTSLVHAMHDNNFYDDNGGWRPRTPSIDPVTTGFDCSGLIWRLARMHDLDYHAKNTRTLLKFTRELDVNEPVRPGDLVWFVGHVMMIGRSNPEEIIESRGYKSGFGRVHALPIAQCFEGINSYAELRAACAAQRPLVLLNRDGTPGTTATEWKLLTMFPRTPTV